VIKQIIENDIDITEIFLESLKSKSFYLFSKKGKIITKTNIFDIQNGCLIINGDYKYNVLRNGISDRHFVLNYSINNKFNYSITKKDIIINTKTENWYNSDIDEFFKFNIDIKIFNENCNITTIKHISFLNTTTNYTYPGSINIEKYSTKYFSLNFDNREGPILENPEKYICVHLRNYESKKDLDTFDTLIKKFKKIYKENENYLILTDNPDIKECIINDYKNCISINTLNEYFIDTESKNKIFKRDKKNLKCSLNEIYYAMKCKEIFISKGGFGRMISSYANKIPIGLEL
jgi:hypothetical protein